jgi:hypothetical protein
MVFSLGMIGRIEIGFAILCPVGKAVNWLRRGHCRSIHLRRARRCAPLMSSLGEGVRTDPPSVFNEHTDKDGAIVFRHACKRGLEGIVLPVRPIDWIKLKNPDSPAIRRLPAGGARRPPEIGRGLWPDCIE